MKAASRIAIPIFAALLTLSAQPPGGRGGPGSEGMRQAIQLDLQGKGAEARELLQKAIDSAATPAAKANAQRAMAMSWGFEGNCKETGKYEQMVMDYWVTREKDDHNAFYQEVHDLGVKEPDISADRKTLWEYRWEHAQARIAARRGNRAEAEKHVTAA